MSVAREYGEVAVPGGELGCGEKRACAAGRGMSVSGKRSRVSAEQTKAVACGARGVDGDGSGVGRGGSRSHRVSRREAANQDEMAELTMRTERRLS